MTQEDDCQSDSLDNQCKKWLKKHFNKKGNIFLTPIHRLDKQVGGPVLFARTSKALTRLNQSMRMRLINKYYRTVVSGFIDKKEGLLKHYLTKKAYKSSVSHQKKEGAKEA